MIQGGDNSVELFPPDPEAGAECVELERPVGGNDLSPCLSLPVGYEVYRMGRALIEKSPQLDASLLRYGTIDTFLESGLGVCILRGHEYVCKAGADMEVGGAREAGLVTEPRYRRLGFGTSVVAHLLQWCVELGCSTDWDCVS